MFQKDMRISFLLDFYGDTLSERRREIIEMYYNEDLSLSEIAEQTGISRQGVRDSVKKSEKELLELEETLGLAERFSKVKKETENICVSLSGIIGSVTDDSTRDMLCKIKDRLEKLEI